MTALAAVLSLALLQSGGVQSIGQAEPGTAEIRGRVTDKETGRPVQRAIVRVSMVGGRRSLTAHTDEDGRYRFTELPPGQYAGSVEGGEFRGTYLTGFLASTAAAAARRPIELKPGEIRENVDIALSRALAMTVRVVDESGEPLTGVRVALRNAADGRNAFVDYRRTTDDRGLIRAFRLASGRYIVCAEPAGPGPPAGRTSDRPEWYLRTCYPSNLEAQAEPVRLDGSDLDGIEIVMRRGRTFRISGVVLDASGSPVTNGFIMLTRFERNGSSGTSSRVGADGRFSMQGVVPGDYAIEVQLGGPERPEQRREPEAAYVPVHVESSDIDGLVVSTVRSADVAGRIALEDPAVRFELPAGSAPLLISARLADDQLPGVGSARTTVAGNDRVFKLTGMFGRRMLDVANVPRGWYVKSIQYRGQEIIDRPVEFKAGSDPADLQVILSARGTTIAGRVLDDRGEPVRGARVVLLHADLARWRRVPFATAFASTAGAFRIGPQREGDYLLVALSPSVQPLVPDDREQLTRLAAVAERIHLDVDETRTIDLRIVIPR